MNKLCSYVTNISLLGFTALAFSGQVAYAATPPVASDNSSAESSCKNPKVAVLFGNGFNDAPQNWVVQRDALKKTIGTTYQTDSGEVVCLSYGISANPSTANLRDMIKIVTQALKDGTDWFDDATLDTQVADIKSLLVEQKLKVLVVGHSQGTLYANSDYLRLAADKDVTIGNVGIVHAASVTKGVAGNGGYITSTNDRVVGTVRFFLRKVLKPNVTLPSEFVDADGNKYSGHAFMTYLQPAVGAKSGDPTPMQVMMRDALASLNQSP